MLMTPLLAGAMPDEQNLQAGLENKKAASCSGFRMGNRAAGCHFRPYSFASSPFDDFADMKNSTRKIVCQPLSAPPLDGPPTTAHPGLPEARKSRRRGLPPTRFDPIRASQAKQPTEPDTCAKRHGKAPSAPQNANALPAPASHTETTRLQPPPDRHRCPSPLAFPLQPARHPHTSRELWGSIPAPTRKTVLTLH
mgnify:CR=1 FL=1